MAAGQHRVQHHGQVRLALAQLGDQFGDHACIGRAAGDADLHGVDGHLGYEGLRLAPQQLGRHRLHAIHTVIVLHCQGRDHGQRMSTLRRDGQDIGGDAGAARRVDAGKHQHCMFLEHHASRPAIGDDGEAANFLGMRPAKNASRPARTASFMAFAMRTGSRAPAIAVFINTPSQPSSMAIAASDAVPTPASTSTGTLACSMISDRFHGFKMPMPEPISEASGITATTPISSSMRAWMGSSLQYTITSKPSLTSVSAAFNVSGIFGNKVFSSPSTSSLTSLWPPSNSRASCKV